MIPTNIKRKKIKENERENNNYNAQCGCIKTQWESYWLAKFEGE